MEEGPKGAQGGRTGVPAHLGRPFQHSLRACACFSREVRTSTAVMTDAGFSLEWSSFEKTSFLKYIFKNEAVLADETSAVQPSDLKWPLKELCGLPVRPSESCFKAHLYYNTYLSIKVSNQRGPRAVSREALKMGFL